MYALQTVSLSIKPEAFCDATRTRYEGNQLYYGSSYSSVDGKSIPSAFLMKTHRYRYGLCDLIANWKCKCKRVLFLSSLWLQNNIRQFIFYTCFNFFWLHVYLIFQKIFFINLYIHMKKNFIQNWFVVQPYLRAIRDALPDLVSIQVPTVL